MKVNCFTFIAFYEFMVCILATINSVYQNLKELLIMEITKRVTFIAKEGCEDKLKELLEAMDEEERKQAILEGDNCPNI